MAAWITIAVVVMMALAWIAAGLLLRIVADPRTASSGGGTTRRFVSILVVGILAAGAISFFSPSRRVSIPPPSDSRFSRLTPRSLQRQAAESAVASAALAGQKALANELSPIKIDLRSQSSSDVYINDGVAFDVKPGLAIRMKVRSTLPHSVPERALTDALETAQKKLVVELRSINPPIEVVPSTEMIRRDFLRPGSLREVHPTSEIKELWRRDGLGESRQWVEFDVEVSDSQIRALRSMERTTEGGMIAAAAFAVFASIFSFLRLDTLTKGYLTTTLAFGAAGLVGLAVTLLVWTR